MKDDKIYLIHILESIEKIENFLRKKRQISDIDEISRRCYCKKFTEHG